MEKQLELPLEEFKKVEIDGWLSYESYIDPEGKTLSYGMYVTWEDGTEWIKTNLVDEMRAILKPSQEQFVDGFCREVYGGPFKITIEKVN